MNMKSENIEGVDAVIGDIGSGIISDRATVVKV